jgi:phosphate transport system protein
MSDDLRKTFHEQLDGIRESITRLAAGVIESIPRATQILLDGDLEGAEYVIRADGAVNEHARVLEEDCYEVLALQAPVAGDLRAIVAAVKLVGEIERSADLVVNLCKAARRMYPCQLDPKLRGLITRMGEQARQLFQFAIDAYFEADAPLAAALVDMDDFLDRLQASFIVQIFESHAHGNISLEVAVQLALVARFYERIGDHAVNIGQRVRYMVTGNLPEDEREARRLEAMSPSADSSSEHDADPTGVALRSDAGSHAAGGSAV